MSTLPFEALITEESLTVTSFKDLKYLIQQQSISYHFSASLWNTPKTRKKNNKSLTWFAPIDFQEEFELPALPGSLEEAGLLEGLFLDQNWNVRGFLKNTATETNLNQNLSGEILHLPTHGEVNIQHPELSCIYLTKDAKNDGILYSGEIYNLTLDYDLITLSACETGLGKLSKGEGVIGLSRALLYAGANNIAVSFWKVNDASTTILMSDFYRNYLEKSNYDTSLKDAKMRMIQSKKYASPYYWAAFILVGN